MKNTPDLIRAHSYVDCFPAGGNGSAPPSDPTKVNKAGDTMTGSLNIDDSSGDLSLAVVNSLNGSIALHGWYIRMAIGPAPFSMAADPNGCLTVGYRGIDIGSGGPVETELWMDQTTGDLITKAIAGPNAGKSVNLTAGKWV